MCGKAHSDACQYMDKPYHNKEIKEWSESTQGIKYAIWATGLYLKRKIHLKVMILTTKVSYVLYAHTVLGLTNLATMLTKKVILLISPLFTILRNHNKRKH